jgi:hypothetical protein
MSYPTTRVGSITLSTSFDITIDLDATESRLDGDAMKGTLRFEPGTYEVRQSEHGNPFAQIGAEVIEIGESRVERVSFGLNAYANAYISGKLPGLTVDLDDAVKIASFQYVPGRTAYHLVRRDGAPLIVEGRPSRLSCLSGE